MPSAENDFTVGYVLSLDLEKHGGLINKITDVAINEFTLETALDKMLADLRGTSFELVQYRDSDTFLVTNTEELQSTVDDQLVMLSTMLSSTYIITFMVTLIRLSSLSFFLCHVSLSESTSLFRNHNPSRKRNLFVLIFPLATCT